MEININQGSLPVFLFRLAIGVIATAATAWAISFYTADYIAKANVETINTGMTLLDGSVSRNHTSIQSSSQANTDQFNELNRKLDLLLEKQGGLETTVAVNATNIGSLQAQIEKIDVAIGDFGETLETVAQTASFQSNIHAPPNSHGPSNATDFFRAMTSGEVDASEWKIEDWGDFEKTPPSMQLRVNKDGSITTTAGLIENEYFNCIGNISGYYVTLQGYDDFSQLPEEQRSQIIELCGG